ncbi:MAG: hypothetical protein M1828_007560 [Chrysothrix sp. TS-e1954]|nr:MAG: hypothetical protein M1828_007560 [Chrysothrix sp. TS-e1954]
MINTKNLSELLTRNVHSEMYPRLFAMTPNGTVVAYSKPANIKQVRDQAAVVMMTLKDQLASNTDETDQPDLLSGNFQALTIELDSHSIIARPLRTNLLLILVGHTSADLQRPFQVVLEHTGDPEHPARLNGHVQDDEDAGFPDGEQSEAKVKTALQAQRMKADALVDHINHELDGLNMPEDAYQRPVE